jgi:hypothetical protein
VVDGFDLKVARLKAGLHQYEVAGTGGHCSAPIERD